MPTGFPSTKQNILQELLKQGRATASALAKALDISSQAIRRHLSELETEGVIERSAVRTGMGRPQYYYQLSEGGRALFPHRYGEFAVDFLLKNGANLDTMWGKSGHSVGENPNTVILI